MEMKAFFKQTLIALLAAGAIGGTFFLSLGLLVSHHESKPEKADVIVVLGGDNGPRVEKGGELYKAGYAPHVLVTGIDSRYYRSSRPDWRERRLKELGIPEKAISVDTKSETTWDEALNSVETMKQKGWSRAIVVSDPPHMLRLHYTWSKAVEGSSKSFVLVSTRPDWWQPMLWWNNETSRRFVISEVQKNIYYAIVH